MIFPYLRDKNVKNCRLIGLSVLFGIFFVMLLMLGLLQPVMHNPDMSQRTTILAVSTLQDIMAFIIPAFLCAWAISTKPASMICIDRIPTVKNVAGVIILFLISIPALNQIVWWNQQMVFPDALSGLEQKLRSMEEAGAATAETILDIKSIGGMISGVLVVGLLTGFSEELFFRGGIQRCLTITGMHPSAAIWISAAVFSFLHFQFFGFVPRLLLGAMFGYLLLWTGSIWIPSLAHALNNSLVVVSAWCIQRGYLPQESEMWGVTTSGFPIWSSLSAAAIIIFLIAGRKYFFTSRLTRLY